MRSLHLARDEQYSPKTPGIELQLLLAAVFDVAAEDVERYPWPLWLPGREDLHPVGVTHTVPVLRDAQKAVMNRARRTFLSYSTLGLAGLAAQ
ncbi:hypothetical protein [Streptomyces xanthophaeus]|uniref:hypothetical protein n=1 Tax=Streptomyces xanthophaeus TaxID=67385 RepID=UPI0037181E21